MADSAAVVVRDGGSAVQLAGREDKASTHTSAQRGIRNELCHPSAKRASPSGGVRSAHQIVGPSGSTGRGKQVGGAHTHTHTHKAGSRTQPPRRQDRDLGRSREPVGVSQGSERGRAT
ncbi:hypothetical protein CDD83_10707 [Cordyceps sp. RAO-2017]|nr:hypothetical protein CDD83_10707 [Cordyceps sp. RAO-2017]